MHLIFIATQTVHGKARNGLQNMCMLNNSQKYRITKCLAVSLQAAQRSLKRLVGKASKYQEFRLKFRMAVLKTHLLRIGQELGKISAYSLQTHPLQ